MHHHHAKYFKAFLAVYLIFSIYMLSEHNFGNLIGMTGLGLGLLVALLAHSRYGYLTIGLLLVHMVIEWSEHGLHWADYSSGEMTMNVIHIALDFIFLYQELKVHAARYFAPIFSGIIVVLCLIFAHGMYIEHSEHEREEITENSTEEAHEDEHGGSLVESFVVGGMFGCILSHLFRRKDECGHSHD